MSTATDMMRTVLVPIHREGWRFVAIFAAVTLVLWWLAAPLGWLGVVATLWCVYFFRDPERVTPDRRGILVSPADGVIQAVDEAVPPKELGMGAASRRRICIFMNVFNVHVNRVPAGGVITKTAYRKGKFLNASLDKASEDNERQAVRMSTASGQDIAFVQIAGLVARRILCTLDANQTVIAGERFGLIRFGSRVDVYLDDDSEPLVLVGQQAIAGETVIAEPRRGESGP